VDVRDLTAASLRETLGMVTQDGHLFHDTIRANLLLARPGAAEEELWEVLRRARLDGLIAALAGRSRHGRRRTRLPPLRRGAPAADHRPAAAGPPSGW
jgi:ABC-type multidrug transport system fused ATPase/permease subunit